VPKSRLMNTVCEDAGELAFEMQVEVDLLKKGRANSRVLAAEDRFRTWSLPSHEAASSHFLGVEGCECIVRQREARRRVFCIA